MPNSPTLGLSLMTAAQAQKEVVFNNFLIAMDALFKGSVLDATLTTPPGSPALGDAYIVGGVGAGLWSGHNYAVAFYFNGWQFIAPPLKLRLYSAAQAAFYIYQNSTLHWVVEPASTVTVLGDLTNVEGTPADGDVLTWINADGKWKGSALVYPSTTLHALTDVNVTEGSGINGYALAWNQSSGRWIASQFLSTPPNFFTLPAIDLSGVAAGSLATYQPTGGPAGGPRINFTPASSLALVEDLGQVGDVSYPGGGSPAISTGAYLQWDGAAWVPSTSAVVYSWAGIVDGPGTFTGHALKLVRVNSIENAIEYFDASALAGATHINDLLDVLSTSPADKQVLAWKNADSQWEPATVAAVAYTGAYSDLSGRPSLATVATSGAYADLSGRPTIPTNASFTLSALGDVNITGGLSNGNVLEWNSTDSRWEPGSASGVSTLVALTDTNISTGSGVDGYVVYWDNGTGKFKLKAAGGGALSALTDVVITSPANTEVLTYDSATSKWKNAAASGGGGGGSGPGGTMTPPLSTAFTAVTNLDSATMTNRTSGVFIPSLHLHPGAGSADGRLSCMLEAAPAGNMSIVARLRDTHYDRAGGWHSSGIVFHNSSGTKSLFHMRATGYNIQLYKTKWNGNFSSYSGLELGGGPMQGDWFQHLDYDGTNIKMGISRNGLDIVWFDTEALSFFLGAITHVGIGWSGATDVGHGPEWDIEHYHSGALGTNGL